jgi:predicted nucleotidyltransferase
MRRVVSVRLDPATIESARSRARQQNRTLSNYIEGLLQKDLEEAGNEPSQVRGSERALRAIRLLKAHRAGLERMGVRHSWIFGSTARGDERPDSDLDILVEVDPGVVNDLFHFGEIQQSLEEWLNCPVDVADKARLRPEVAQEAERDQILAF